MPPKNDISKSRIRSPSLETGSHAKKKRRVLGRTQATVYDAVANRINYEGFIKSPFLNEFKEEKVRSGVPRPADEILARRRRAPDDVAPLETLTADNRLPDDSLMVAIHQYAADFYCSNGMGQISSRSLDGTALIAMGLLLEETIEHVLDGCGHLALVDKHVLESKDEAGIKTQKKSSLSTSNFIT